MVLAAGGLLVGWYGLAAVAVALVAGVALSRFDGWGALAAAAMLMVGAGLSWDRITQETWANEWRQGWSLAVVAFLVAALMERSRESAAAPEPGPAVPSVRRTGRS